MTAEEKFREVFTLGFAAMPPHIPKYIYQAMIEFAQMKVEEALKAANENSTVEVIYHEEWKVTNLPGFERGTNEVILPVYGVDEDSILSAYPKENIK